MNRSRKRRKTISSIRQRKAKSNTLSNVENMIKLVKELRKEYIRKRLMVPIKVKFLYKYRNNQDRLEKFVFTRTFFGLNKFSKFETIFKYNSEDSIHFLMLNLKKLVRSRFDNEKLGKFLRRYKEECEIIPKLFGKKVEMLLTKLNGMTFNNMNKRNIEKFNLSNPVNLFVDMCSITIPSDVILHILSYMKKDSNLIQTIGCINSSFYINVLLSWKKVVINSDVLKKNVYSIPIVVLQSVMKLYIVGNNWTKNEFEHLFKNIQRKNIRYLHFGLEKKQKVFWSNCKDKDVFENVETFVVERFDQIPNLKVFPRVKKLFILKYHWEDTLTKIGRKESLGSIKDLYIADVRFMRETMDDVEEVFSQPVMNSRKISKFSGIHLFDNVENVHINLEGFGYSPLLFPMFGDLFRKKGMIENLCITFSICDNFFSSPGVQIIGNIRVFNESSKVQTLSFRIFLLNLGEFDPPKLSYNIAKEYGKHLTNYKLVKLNNRLWEFDDTFYCVDIKYELL